MRKAKISPIGEVERIPLMGAALLNAQEFLNACRVLRAHNNACVTTKQQPVFIVDVVNLAFGIELLLKALLYGAGKKAKSHNLDELFEFLSPQTQEEVKRNFAELLIRTTGHSRDIFGLTFEDKLKQYAKTYENWRYLHEKNPGSFHSDFCENLALVLNEMAATQFNELHNAYWASQIA